MIAKFITNSGINLPQLRVTSHILLKRRTSCTKSLHCHQSLTHCFSPFINSAFFVNQRIRHFLRFFVNQRTAHRVHFIKISKYLAQTWRRANGSALWILQQVFSLQNNKNAYQVACFMQIVNYEKQDGKNHLIPRLANMSSKTIFSY